MARPKRIDDEEILEAARDAFLEDGIQATTAEIAQRAGISEGTIYRRFATKHQLFVAAMDIPFPPAWIDSLDEIGPENDLREALDDISLEIIDFFEEIIPKVNMVMCNLDDEQIFETAQGAPPVQTLKPVIRFFRDELERGRLAQCDPEVTARMFLGSLFHFAFAEVSGVNDILPMPRETYVRGLVETLLRGAGFDRQTAGA